MKKLQERLYLAALKLVQEAEESPEGVTLPSVAFYDLEIAVNFIRERQAMTTFEGLMELETS
jgi:hypothetical protein